MHVSLSLYKGRKGWDTVADEVVSSAQDVQIHLGRVWLKTHHFYLKHQKKKYTTKQPGR